ncbi:MAG: hypothetical protein HYY51_01240 [Candidatus Magasanikbacteria bacterium]|nr:hypothetical protein [Candidatus Magasanikbacteria bacterium]
MKHNAPHLPERSAQNKTALQNLKWLFTSIIISVLTALVTSVLIFNTFFPFANGENNLSFVSRIRNQAIEYPEDPQLLRNMRERVVRLYSVEKVQKGYIYPRSAYIGQGIMLSSDGWGVLYPVDSGLSEDTELKGLDYQGIAHSVEKKIVESKSGLVFFKLSGFDFRVVPLTSWPDPLKNREVLWSFDGVWKAVKLEETVSFPKDAFVLWDTPSLYRLDTAAKSGDLVITRDAKLVGFVNKAGYLIPSWLVEHHLASVLQEGILNKNHVYWKGYFVEGWIDENTGLWSGRTGFYVSSNPKVSSEIKSGDLIIAINGKEVAESNFVQDLYLAGPTASLRILRNGKEYDVELSFIPKS